MSKKNLSKDRAVIVIVCVTVLLTSGIWLSTHYLKTKAESLEIPRMFLRLERATGYDGFIHNFENYVLHPDDDVYLRRAEENFREAQAALSAIKALNDKFNFPNTLQPFEDTLNQYHDLLFQVKDAKENGLSTVKQDELVRISDAIAGSAIHEFQMEVEETITKRHNRYFLGLLFNFVILTIMLMALLYSQISRRRQAEIYNEKLRENEKRLLAAESIAKLGRWKSDINGRLTWSEMSKRMFGIKTDQLQPSQKLFWSQVHPEDRQKLKTAIRNAAKRGDRFSCVHRLVCADGSILTICNSGTICRDEKGNRTGFAGTFQDISTMIDMEERLNQAKQMEIIGKLSGGLANDFNNLLSIIQANIQLVLESQPPNLSKTHLNTAMLAINRGADLTRSMLCYARKSLLRPTRINLNQMVREKTGWSARILPQNIQIENLLTDDLWDIHTDINFAQSAMLNLVHNAADAMPNGGTVTIKTENICIKRDSQNLKAGNYVMLSISDTGTGIPQDILPKIFEPFYTTKSICSRSGLGLSMVIGFMEQAGGVVDVVTNPQLGTTFKLYFKAAIGQRNALPLHQHQFNVPVQETRMIA